MVPFPSAACMILICLVKCSHYSCLSAAIFHRVFCDPKKNQNCGMACGFETSKPRNSQLAVEVTLWLFNIAMGNGPFIVGLPIKNGNFPWLC
jgi:hypothetical protein